MPFDAAETVARTVTDQIGLTPVPMEVLTAYKERVRTTFFADPQHQVRNRLAKWVEYSGAVFRQHNLIMLDWAATNLGTVPDDVKTVVGETERRLKAAGVVHEKVLGRFDTDPYVVFRWRENGEPITKCVAVWDAGAVVHIAKLT